jgi:dephospho-CoA kinase
MKIFGLTGGIASGKSTVSKMFRDLGVALVDADEVARLVVLPKTPALREISQRFPGVVTSNGHLDRPALAKRIFEDASEREALNAIVHPRIQEFVDRRIEELRESGVDLVIYDAPLLIENGLHRALSGVVLVVVSPDVQLERLRARSQLSEAEARLRIASQLPLDAKRRHATWVIDNGGSLENTRAQVEAVLREMRASPMGEVK